MGQGTGQVNDEQHDEIANDPEVERLVEDIEETRNDMTGTVEEIGERLDPKNIVADAKETVRAATVGKVEEMANTAGDMASEATQTVREAGSGVLDTITRNPVPAAMVGLGIGWLVMSNRSNADKASWERARSQRTSWDGSTYDSSRGSNGHGAVDKAQQKVGEVAGDVERKVGQAADQVGRLADEVPYQVRTAADDLTQTASHMFESNPLAIGAIAVAVGTAVGLALPPTDMERRKLALPAREAIGKAEEVATDALEQVEQQARDVEEQALEEDRQAKPH